MKTSANSNIVDQLPQLTRTAITQLEERERELQAELADIAERKELLARLGRPTLSVTTTTNVSIAPTIPGRTRNGKTTLRAAVALLTVNGDSPLTKEELRDQLPDVYDGSIHNAINSSIYGRGFERTADGRFFAVAE